INEQYQGVHVVDNSNRNQPVITGIINFPGNEDISAKDDHLFAYSLAYLVVLGSSGMANIQTVNRLEDVLEGSVLVPVWAHIEEPPSHEWQDKVLVGWTTSR